MNWSASRRCKSTVYKWSAKAPLPSTIAWNKPAESWRSTSSTVLGHETFEQADDQQPQSAHVRDVQGRYAVAGKDDLSNFWIVLILAPDWAGDGLELRPFLRRLAMPLVVCDEFLPIGERLVRIRVD